MKKSLVIEQLENELNKKIAALKTELDSTKAAMMNETKSSAGDKHETSRAMGQIEVDKLGNQLEQSKQLLQHFKQINFETANAVKSGSLIETNNGWFLLGVPFGKLTVETKSVFCISLISPLGKLLLNKGLKEVIKHNGNEFRIINIQ